LEYPTRCGLRRGVLAVGVVARDAVVEVGAKPGEETVERVVEVECWVADQGFDTSGVPVP
jgi:hypothetical protein